MPMEYVYAESLFLLNFIVDYFILVCSGKVSGAVLRRGRIALAAALGGVYSVLVLLPGAAWLSSPLMKLVSGLLMALAAFGGETRFLRSFVVFLAVSAAFGGAVWAASMLTHSGVSGRIYVPVSLRVLIISFAVCWAAVSVVFRRAGKKAEREIAALTLTFRGRTVSLRALRDTGNALYDPISGRAVAVCDRESLSPLLSGVDIDLTDPASALEKLSALPGLAGRLTLVPYRAVGTKSGLLLALRPESAEFAGARVDILAALSPSPLSAEGEYQAVIY